MLMHWFNNCDNTKITRNSFHMTLIFQPLWHYFSSLILFQEKAL